MNTASLTSLLLRAITLASKFLLILILAKYLEPEAVGVFGILSVTVALGIYLAGFEFYSYNAREILSHGENQFPKYIKDQLYFHFLAYVVICPLLFIIFVGGWLAWEYLFWFYPLLILEHLSQEAYRLLITLGKPVQANLVLFFRSGAWVYVVVSFIVLVDEARTLQFVIAGWLVGILISMLITGKVLSCYSWKGISWRSLDLEWIKRGINIAFILFLGVLCVKIMEFADRYFIRHFFDDAHVGVYTFYANIANVVQTFIYTGVISIIFPNLIRAYQEKRVNDYRHLIRKMFLYSLVGLIIVGVCIAIFIHPVLSFVNRDMYSNNLEILWVMIGTMSVIVLGFVPHYSLYVRSMDVAILVASVLACAMAILMNFMLVPSYGLMGAAASTFIGALVLVAAKSTLILFTSSDGKRNSDKHQLYKEEEEIL